MDPGDEETTLAEMIDCVSENRSLLKGGTLRLSHGNHVALLTKLELTGRAAHLWHSPCDSPVHLHSPSNGRDSNGTGGINVDPALIRYCSTCGLANPGVG